MVKAITVGQQSALNASGIVMRSMILFDFPEGYFGFWTGIGPLTRNTITFVGAASLISVERDEESLELESNGGTARLRANPELGLTPDVLATIEEYAYRNRPVTIYRVLLNVTTGIMIDDPIVEWRGIVDLFTHDEGADGDYVLTGKFVSRSIDYTRRGPMVRSSAHQDLISAGDLFFDYTGYSGSAQIYFGTKVPKKLGSKRSQATRL